MLAQACCTIWRGCLTLTSRSSRSARVRRTASRCCGTPPRTCLRKRFSAVPGTRLGIGPPIENGFYYDFLPSRPFTPEDLAAIEKKMAEIIKAGQRFVRRPITDDEARIELADEPFKLELIDLKGSALPDEAAVEVGSDGLTMYDNVDARTGERVWTDLCRGPHLPTTRRIPAFTLMRTAAAYWRGSEKNPQLQRIYGTAWASRDDLKAYLAQLEEAAKRDHRKIGTELDLFSFPDEIGPGLAVFHPKGGVLRKEMEDYARRRHEEEGYEFVFTPHITKGVLFEISKHLEWYAESMYPPMHLDAEVGPDGELRKQGQDYYLKPMNCPMHCLIYRARAAVISRVAAATVRVRLGLSVREVRSGARLDPGARNDAGRRAHLLCARAVARRADVVADFRPGPAARLRT